MPNPDKLNIDIRPLVIGEYPLGETVNIAQDAGAIIPAGAVLGRSTVGTPANAVAVGGNTGNGTVSASPTRQAGAQVGTYRIVFIAATVFEVFDPQGTSVGIGRTGVAFASQLGFTITAGGTAFVAGDAFTIAVPAGDNLVRRSVSTAVDGSQFPLFVTSQDIDARNGARNNIQVLREAVLRRDGVVFTGSETRATVVPGFGGGTFEELLYRRGIILVGAETNARFDN